MKNGMMKLTKTGATFVCAAGMLVAITSASAHDGRRFRIEVVDDTLVAQGYISGANPSDDGGGVVRPYINAIHGHWENNPAPGVNAASADLPGCDLFSGGALTGYSVTLTLHGATKWMDPPMMPPAGTVPELVALESGEEIFVSYGGELVSSASPGAMVLLENVQSGGHLDLDLSFDIGMNPSAVLFALEFTLSTDAPGVADSGPVSIILSPDGSTMMERLHHAALYLETRLGQTLGCEADLAEPSGTLDFFDVLEYLARFDAGDASADLASPAGVFDFFDVLEYLARFDAGC